MRFGKFVIGLLAMTTGISALAITPARPPPGQELDRRQMGGGPPLSPVLEQVAGSLAAIGDKAAKLGEILKGFKGGIKDGVRVHLAAVAVANEIRKAREKFERLRPELGHKEALLLSGVTVKLLDGVQTTLGQLVANVDVLNKLWWPVRWVAKRVTRWDLKLTRRETLLFGETLVRAMPPGNSPNFRKMVQEINLKLDDAFLRAIKAYGG